MTTTTLPPRVARYSGIIPIEKLQANPVTIVGCGSIGRQVALALASMGVTKFTLYDPDIIEEENLGTQGWSPYSLGEKKVKNLDEDIEWLTGNIEGADTTYLDRKAKRSDTLGEIVFCCVDSMESRSDLYKSFCKHGGEFFCDTRMGAEVFVVHTISDHNLKSKEHYAATLFPDSDANPAPCTARSTYYCALLAAGFAINAYTHHLRGLPPVKSLHFDLPTNQVMDCIR
jgi:sulfur carrier protein ThiS adenylyltransferase